MDNSLVEELEGWKVLRPIYLDWKNGKSYLLLTLKRIIENHKNLFFYKYK